MLRKLISLIMLVLFLTHCGGGTDGTSSGGGRSVDGSVVTTQSQPIVGVVVTDVASGQATVTDQDGRFSLTTPDIETSVELQVDFQGESYQLPLEGGQGAKFDVRIEIDPAAKTASVRNVDVRAKIVGQCDFAFENNATIRQSNRLNDGTICPLELRVVSSRGPRSGIPFALEHRRCSINAKWSRVISGATGGNGIGRDDFVFHDDDEHCEYRVVVATGAMGEGAIIFPIRTFRSQRG